MLEIERERFRQNEGESARKRGRKKGRRERDMWEKNRFTVSGRDEAVGEIERMAREGKTKEREIRMGSKR